MLYDGVADSLEAEAHLRGVKLMPVLKKITGGQPEALKDFPRIGIDIRTDQSELPDIEVLYYMYV